MKGKISLVKPSVGTLLVMAAQGRWEMIMQMLRTTAYTRLIPSIAAIFEERGDQRGLRDKAAPARFIHIAFWCRWVLVERSKTLEQRAERGVEMQRVKDKLDAAMACDQASSPVPREDLSRRIVELARNLRWEEAEKIFERLQMGDDPDGDIAAACGASFEDAAAQAKEDRCDLKLWLYRKSLTCYERFAATPSSNKEEAQARHALVERTSAMIAEAYAPSPPLLGRRSPRAAE